jgi:hypothetical protein
MKVAGRSTHPTLIHFFSHAMLPARRPGHRRSCQTKKGNKIKLKKEQAKKN